MKNLVYGNPAADQIFQPGTGYHGLYILNTFQQPGLPVPIPEDSAARQIARVMVCRAAKIAAILTAGGILRSCAEHSVCTLVIEGSQFEKLTGFAPAFRQELSALLHPLDIAFEIIKVENSCLLGAALAAFAEPM